MQEQQRPQSVNIPNLGKHLILDFVGIKLIDVNNYEQVHSTLQSALDICNLQIITSTHKKFEPYGLTELFMIDHGHLTIHTWPENCACAIDFYYSGNDSLDYQKKVEEHLCDNFGWEACTSTLSVPRGKMTKLCTYDAPTKTEILNQVSFVHREKSDYQDIRIYDTIHMGRILLLDGYVQITDELEDNYTKDMANSVCKKEGDIDHLLIIGGGDFLIVHYILKTYPNVKKISLCELDGRVIECVKEFFQYGKLIKESEEKINVVLKDGAAFVSEQVQLNNKYDGLIIDCSDTFNEDYPAYTLTTPDFYRNVKQILNPGSKIVQQLTEPTKVDWFQGRWQEAGLNKSEILVSHTPQYGEDLPLGIITIE